MLDLNHALTVAEDAARRAGALVLEMSRGALNVEYKSILEVVTEADKASEALIVAALRGAFPDHAILGEEGTGRGEVLTSVPYRWHVDPIDGTSNYSRGIPHYAVSIALADADNVPLVGVVFDPTRGECFTATRGGGSRLNGQPIHVSRVANLERAIVTSGFPGDRWTNPDNNTEEWTHFVLRAQGTRRLGSAALDLCYVANGRLDAFWEPRINSWDVMAGLLLVTEAGGRVSNYRGALDKVYTGEEVLASNGLIHEEMMTVIILGASAPRPSKLGK